MVKFLDLKSDLRTSSEEFVLIDYNIGYSNFKLKDYKNAAFAFRNFLNNNSLETKLKEDALIRLGDSYFALGDYRNAINTYSKVVQNSSSDADYAEYQLSLIHI